MRPDWDLLEADQPYHSQGSSLRERHCPDVPLRVTTFSCSTGLPSMPPGQYSRWELWWGGGAGLWKEVEPGGQTQQPQVTLGFGVQKSWTHQENTNEQQSKVLFQVCFPVCFFFLKTPLVLCDSWGLVHCDFFLIPLSFYNTESGDKERRLPFYRRLKYLEDDPSSKKSNILCLHPVFPWSTT